MMPSRSNHPRPTSPVRRLLWVLPLLAVLLTPQLGHGQDDEPEEPKPQKEWVIGYSLLCLPMAGAMFFMFRMSKRQEFKVKKSDDDE